MLPAVPLQHQPLFCVTESKRLSCHCFLSHCLGPEGPAEHKWEERKSLPRSYQRRAFKHPSANCRRVLFWLTFYQKGLWFLNNYVWVFFLQVSLCSTRVPGVRGCQKRMWDLELESQKVASCRVCWQLIMHLPQERTALLTTELCCSMWITKFC